MSALPANAGYSYPLGLFEGYGVELEYAIVDRDTLDVRPVADRVFRAATGADASDYAPDGPGGVASWSNELALHVIEIKSTSPLASLDGLEAVFQSQVGLVQRLLDPMDCRLMPTGMHPWMNPGREMRLWPHEYTEVYRAYDRIFGCEGHGWGNVQSTHINLSFGNDEQFGRLHAAVRLVLALIPAVAASSPLADGRWSAHADHRMEVYRTNSRPVPMMTGLVIPEPVYTREAYEGDILGRLYDDLAPLDPGGVLRHEFANARGAIARFDRGAIEIRVMDIQECPAADLAVVRLICATIRAVVAERWTPLREQQSVPTGALHRVLLDTIRDGEAAVVSDAGVLRCFGHEGGPARAGALWAGIAARVCPGDRAVQRLLNAGTLSTRIRRAVGEHAEPDRLRTVYGRLCDCLAEGRLFDAP